MTVPVKVSDSKSLYSLDYFVPQGKSIQKKKWIESHRLFMGMTTMGERIMTPVYIGTDPRKKTFLMDVITGSLYDISTKKCLSSSNLKLIGEVTERKGIEKLLMNIKGESCK